MKFLFSSFTRLLGSFRSPSADAGSMIEPELSRPVWIQGKAATAKRVEGYGAANVIPFKKPGGEDSRLPRFDEPQDDASRQRSEG